MINFEMMNFRIDKFQNFKRNENFKELFQTKVLIVKRAHHFVSRKLL